MAALNTHELGSGERVAFAVHGVTAHGARFRALADSLDGWRLVCVDLRGHGASPWEPPWNAEQHVADLIDTLDAAGLGRVPVIGHSFGGMLAMHLAAAAPERVERLVLVDPAVALDAVDMLETAEEHMVDDGWASPEKAREAKLEFRPQHAAWAVDEDLAVALERSPDGRYRMRYCRPAVVCAWGEMAREPADLSRFPGEVLLIPALQEDFVNDRLREALRRDVGERLMERPIDASHMLYWDALEELTGVVALFLARRGG